MHQADTKSTQIGAILFSLDTGVITVRGFSAIRQVDQSIRRMVGWKGHSAWIQILGALRFSVPGVFRRK